MSAFKLFNFSMRGLRRTIVVSALVLLSACKTELHSNLDQTDANEMMAKLMEYGISVSKTMEKDTVTLMVDENRFGEAVDILNNAGLPRRRFRNMGEVFNSEGLVASPMQEWARLTFAQSQQLSASISSIPGVVKADVHIANPQKDSPFDEAPEPSASVLIQIEEGAVTEEMIPQIKQLVAFSIPNIKYERVGVILSPVKRTENNSGAFVDFGGIIVHQDSQRSLRLISIVGSIMTVLALVFGGLFAMKMLQGPAKKESST